MSKITDDELTTLQEQEKKKGAILHDLGVLSTQSHSLQGMFAQVMSEQEALKSELEDKYGKINVNLTDGTYSEAEDSE
jgi:hypothetical protein|tara:strand:+ start:256 stop:489 length:234 start_codon:yes stop_codon:yes gene_type:complete